MTYFIIRHPGALGWLQRHVNEPAKHLTHLERPELIGMGDTVIGVLPVNLIADICQRGARYLHLEFHVTEQLRGQELTTEQLEVCGAELVEYLAFRPIPDEAILRDAPVEE